MGGILIIAFLLPTYAYFYQSTQHNEAARFDQTRAILEKHQLSIDSYNYNTADVAIVNVDGQDRVFSAKAPGSSLLALIPVAIIRFGATHLLPIPDWLIWHVIVYFTTILLVGIPSILSALAMYDILTRLTHSRAVAFFTIMAIWCGTIIFPFSTLYFGHVQTASLLVGAFWILFHIRHDGFSYFKRPRLMLLLAGLAAGFAVVVEYPAIIIAVALACYFVPTWRLMIRYLKTRGTIAGFAFVGGALIAAIILASYNLLAFHKLFFASYLALGKTTSTFAGMALGFGGIHWPGWNEFLTVLARITILPQRGLFIVNPILLLALPGFYFGLRRKEFRAEFILAFVLFIVGLIFNACYGNSITYWGGGASTGPRLMITTLPFLALPLALMVRKLRQLTLALLFVSIFFMLIATAVEPRLPYDYKNPVFDFLIPHYLAGQYGLSRDALFDPTNHGLVGHSTAANIGGIIGLPPSLQLVPLMLIWGVVGILVIMHFRPDGIKKYRISLAVVIGLIIVPPVVFANVNRAGSDQGVVAEYWSNANLMGSPAFRRMESEIDANWRDEFPLAWPWSTRWTGVLQTNKAGTYIFVTESDDGVRLYLDGTRIIDDWGPHAFHRADKAVLLSPGKHAIVLEYHNENRSGMVRLAWRRPGWPEETIGRRFFVK